MRVGIIGQGFVGGSLTTVLSERGVETVVYDTAGKVAPGAWRPAASLKELAYMRIVFVCLPTPMRADGSADVSIVEDTLSRLAAMPGDRIAVVKSTVPPGTTDRWYWRFAFDSGLHVVFNPEFLREKSALEDTRTQGGRVVLGGYWPWVDVVENLYRYAFPRACVVKMSSTDAELVKYFTNVHLAARVVLSCELWQLVERLRAQGNDVDYDRIVEVAKLDARLGGSHMAVPGDSGIMGARGSCFPKDLGALAAVMREAGVPEPHLLDAIIQKNLDVVPVEHRDWEKMPGRAVVAKDEEAA